VTINPKIFRTSTFRLAALYLFVFLLSAGALLGYVFWNTVGLLERQTEDTIRAEVQALGDQYRLRSLSGVVDVINRRITDETGTLYLLVNKNGERLIGNLAKLPSPDIPDSSWVDFPINKGKGVKQVRHTARAFHVNLAGGYELLVGRDVEEQRAFRDVILNALYWGLGLALVLGLGGGFLMSRNFLRRVDAITDASRTIMAGDLSQRMPVAGSGDELDRLAGSLNEMLGQIERLMAGMKEVSSNVAHDLKTPLTRLRARAEAALRTTSGAEHRSALQQTISESDKLLQTFNALLSIARAESGQAREGLNQIDAADVLRDVAELYEPLLEDSGGSLKIGALPALHVQADRQLLAQAFSNIIDNAMKYGTAEGGDTVNISLSAHVENDHAVIGIADAGQGIAPEDRERVLGRFVRLDESRSKPGNGLGLSLAASVMKLHSGTLQLADAKPGLKVVLKLPLSSKASDGQLTVQKML
jgi:signal transduction histidine kinase